MSRLGKTMALVLGLGSMLGAQPAKISLTGAGASFPAPVYQVWTYAYTQTDNGVSVSYQSTGSGGGINQIVAGTLDFAGTDYPLSAERLAQDQLIQFPLLVGGVVVIVNLPGLADGALRLDGPTLAAIYLGRIRQWNDPEIAALNPGLKLPKYRITVVRRADSSGTTFLFTDYLSRVLPEWQEKVGAGAAVKWPLGLGGQKNPGVCNTVRKVRGSIGYTEYTYAAEAGLNCVQLRHPHGDFVQPSPASFRAAIAGAEWERAPGLVLPLVNRPGRESWPITGVTYILLRRDIDPARMGALRDFFRWCFVSGAASASKLKYVPMPEHVVKLIEESCWP